VQLVRPQVWKGKFGLRQDKGHSRVIAARRFPSYAREFCARKDEGKAEAALIALFGAENG